MESQPALPPSSGEPFAWQWATQIAQGEVSALEVARHYLDRINQHNAAINAVAAVDADATLATAAAHDRAANGIARRDPRAPILGGVPISVKDNLAAAGLRWSSGTWSRRQLVADTDAVAVARLKAQGALVLAKSNMPELAASYETDNMVVGRTNNPYDLARTAGGSSGGEAALLAADLSPVGVGTDGGGSIRVPAHYCGVFGLRPTAGRIPETGSWPSTRATGYTDFTCVGPMGRCTHDVALLLQVMAGADDVDPYAVDVALPDYRKVELEELRVGVYLDDGVVTPTAEVLKAVERAGTLLIEAGAQVELVTPPGLEEATELFFGATGAMGGHDLLAQLEGSEGHHVPQFETYLQRMQLTEPTAADYFALASRIHEFRSRIRRWLRRYSVILAPVVAGQAPLHGTPPAGVSQEEYFEYLAFNYTHAFSVAGVPAMSVPMGSFGGLPAGVQVVAAPWREDLVLAVAAALERSGPGWVPAPMSME